MNGREVYTLLEFLFVLVWPARQRRIRAERWLHERHVNITQSFPPSFFLHDGTTIFWRYKTRKAGVMDLPLSSLL